ncbi:fluoride efflux transporter CrcB [Paenarthrobacter aurescens]|uniref:Fluoride-specific ion channel FluC n=1 Tax=Paenarthrobacter aurescens TaxID=43663 RepID=A0A4Y3NQ25_PAEAU|nr:fluoride efflux transporter CrcB [Paenarthrobacter aurescens]MDO6144252.1 fluoride efflux transporter CrcB [Paenarthrobacter aurescens]MDO6148099.1 fluoride efflux transporter CrcB [Paenarthrobacter aurescens]MDO6159343.1 fluoride efflux transporter CrcB [Paenarthrobacter aurescens]MDO6163326.1 fluoride efflux transporter CrcB [Paenarthrobacter aurescens]GEB20849.1 putative fluoride ion transporter CrcB [Paenarthrobacter aurescens]
MTVILLALAGGIGAVARFVVDGAIRQRFKTALPWGTILINITGSFALGVLAGAVMRGRASESVFLILGTGFLGGYTTFSTASLETIRLIQSGRTGLALINGLGSMAASVLSATAGVGVGLLLP